MHCSNEFNDYVVQCPDGIKVNAVTGIGAYQSLRWVLRDKFGRHYEGVALTDGLSGFTIDLSDLPDGLLTPYSGEFVLSVVDAVGKPVKIMVAGYYESIRFKVAPGTRVKNNLGEPIDCGDPVVSEGENNSLFTGDGVTTVFNTPAAFVPGAELVFVGGLLYDTTMYTVTNDNEITFNEPPDLGAAIRINY